MKIKRADRTDWQRIVQRRFALAAIEDETFHGHACLLCMDRVSEPLWINCGGRDVCLVDNGYCWLQQFPRGAHHAITTAFDAHGKVVQWYIDVCKQHYVDGQGMVWYEDLYLDITRLPSGEMELLDVNELDEALRGGKVSDAEYELAWREFDALLTAIEEDRFPLLQSVGAYKDQLLALVAAE
ncbi:MAG TPA: DUF402 domain-containing protein [Ktedonobacteraceae bacterium]|nr:DUF402 domain-containing protein [Ktedonobacteraceae bacterium]